MQRKRRRIWPPQMNLIIDYLPNDKRFECAMLSKKECFNVTFHQNSLIQNRNLEVLVNDQGIFIKGSKNFWIKGLPTNLLGYALNLKVTIIGNS
jgi:hypothetical protein